MTTNYSVLPVERMLLRDRKQDALLRIVYIDPARATRGCAAWTTTHGRIPCRRTGCRRSSIPRAAASSWSRTTPGRTQACAWMMKAPLSSGTNGATR